MINTEQLRKLPKTELHRHLDGSVRFETIKSLANLNNIDLEARDDEELWKKTKVTKQLESLEDVIDCFWTHQKVLCNFEAIKRVTFENIEDAYRDGVKLLELRFAPTFITLNKDLTNDEVIEGVLAGLEEGEKKYDIKVGLIHIVPRMLDAEANLKATQDIIRYKNSNHKYADRLVGFDLADSEDVIDMQEFLPLVNLARENGLEITIHSGENTEAAYMKKTIEMFDPKRIGHGIKAWGDVELMNLIRDKNIMLEVCPTSNWLTSSVQSIERHPFPLLYKADLPISLNSDDPQLMNISLMNEYNIAQDIYDFSQNDFLKINKDATKASFLDQDIKNHIIQTHFQ